MSRMRCNKKWKIIIDFAQFFITFTDQRFETIRVIAVFFFNLSSKSVPSWVLRASTLEAFFFFERLIRPHLSRPKTSIQQSIPSPSEGLRSGFWKRQSHRMAPGTGPGTSSDTHISYYAVRAFLFSTHYLVNVDTAGVYQKLLYVVKHMYIFLSYNK